MASVSKSKADQSYPGVNIQFPWVDVLLDGTKTVETRSYPLPDRLAHQWLWMIETPGPKGKFKARVRGKIKFSHSIQYKTRSAWINDYARHRVSPNDTLYAYVVGKPKYGWVVEAVEACEEFAPPSPRGIVWAKAFSGLMKRGEVDRLA